jgi:hypothetical protein
VRERLSSHGIGDVSVERTAPTVEDSFIARMGRADGERAA